MQHEGQVGQPGWDACCFHCFQLSAGLEASALSLSFASPSLGNIHVRAALAVPSPLWREKQRKVAQTKAQQPVKVVRTYRGTKAKFTNWGRYRQRWACIYIIVAEVLHVHILTNNIYCCVVSKINKCTHLVSNVLLIITIIIIVICTSYLQDFLTELIILSHIAGAENNGSQRKCKIWMVKQMQTLGVHSLSHQVHCEAVRYGSE